MPSNRIFAFANGKDCSECCVRPDHRCRGEEVAIQFRGAALDLSKFKNVEVLPDKSIIIPLGMATA